MTPKEKAIDLINSYRIILINEDTECGNEILCTLIAQRCALIAVDEILNIDNVKHKETIKYYTKVKEEINKL